MPFTRTKYSALDGKTKISYIEMTTREDPFTVIAAPDGLHFSGTFTIQTHDELREFADMLDKAWPERQKLNPANKIVTNLSGHEPA